MVGIVEYYDRMEYLKSLEEQGKIADSKEVRLTLIGKVNDGEISLEEAQRRLQEIKDNAKANGQITRAEAYHDFQGNEHAVV